MRVDPKVNNIIDSQPVTVSTIEEVAINGNKRLMEIFKKQILRFNSDTFYNFETDLIQPFADSLGDISALIDKISKKGQEQIVSDLSELNGQIPLVDQMSDVRKRITKILDSINSGKSDTRKVYIGITYTTLGNDLRLCDNESAEILLNLKKWTSLKDWKPLAAVFGIEEYDIGDSHPHQYLFDLLYMKAITLGKIKEKLAAIRDKDTLKLLEEFLVKKYPGQSFKTVNCFTNDIQNTSTEKPTDNYLNCKLSDPQVSSLVLKLIKIFNYGNAFERIAAYFNIPDYAYNPKGNNPGEQIMGMLQKKQIILQTLLDKIEKDENMNLLADIIKEWKPT